MIWKDEYKIGVPRIDKQHMELFARVTDFVETLRSDKGWDIKVTNVNETLNYMKDYVVTHFRDEEAYQEEIGYPQVGKHRKIHQEMVDYIETISEQCEKNGHKEIVMQQIAGKLVTWLVSHVVEEDRKIADHLAAQ
jgi:hemerythrin